MNLDWVGLKNELDRRKAFQQSLALADRKRQQDMQDLLQTELIKAQVKSQMEKEQYAEKIKMLKDLGIFPGMGSQMTPPGQVSPEGFRQPIGREPVFINKSSYNFDPLKGDISIASTPISNPLFEAGQKRRELKRAEIAKRFEVLRSEKIKEREEQRKPYSDITANVIVTSKDLIPKIDELIAMIEKPGDIYGTFPFGTFTGASRIGAAGKEGPWQALKMGTTMGKGREAAVLLKDIRELAFGKGGKTLSENEAAIALSSIDPSYKTEEQWIKGLRSAKKQLQMKLELVSKKSTQSIESNNDPLGIR